MDRTMSFRQIQEQYQVDGEVAFSIEQAMPFGLLGTVDGRVQGVLKYWEWSWFHTLTMEEVMQMPADDIEKKITCRVIGYSEKYHELLLSRRHARRDEWRQAARRLKTGDMVDGLVIRADTEGWYEIRLSDSLLTGCLHARNVPDLPKRMTQGLLIGDEIRAVVERIDSTACSILLNINRALQQKRQGLLVIQNGEPVKGISIGDRLKPAIHLALDWKRKQIAADERELPYYPVTRKHIGWIDDDPGGVSEIQNILRGEGVEIVPLPVTEDSFIEALRTASIDLCILDIDLQDGQSGIDLARKAIDRQLLKPEKIVFFTGIADDRLVEAKQLNPLDVLTKDEYGMSSIRRLIRSLPPTRSQYHAVTDAMIRLQIPAGATPYHLKTLKEPELPDLLKQHLDQLARRTGAEGVYIMSFDVDEGFSLIAESPTGSTCPDRKHLIQLKHSPLADVIHKGEEYWEGKFSGSNRDGFVIPVWGSFDSIGIVPMRIFGIEPHILVIIARNERYSFDRELVHEYAHFFQAIIERRELLAINSRLSDAARAGMLAVGVVHDLRNRANPVVGAIQLSLERTTRSKRKGASPSTDDLTAWVDDLSRISGHMQNLLDPIQRLFDAISQHEPHDCDYTKIIRRAVENIKAMELTRKAKVEIKLSAGQLPALVKGSGLVLETILFNLLINAVQQIQLSGESTGLVQVDAGMDDESGLGKNLLIRVTDSGPGIHQRDFDRIFTFRFTTRPPGEGSGVGLFHVRQLSSGISATVQVEKSTLFFGTAFKIAIPVVADSGGIHE